MISQSTFILAAAVLAGAVETVFALTYAWGMTSSNAALAVGRGLHWPVTHMTDWIIGDGKGLRLRHEFFLNVALQFALLFCLVLVTIKLLAFRHRGRDFRF